MKCGVIGLGDMGSGLALNLIKNGFETSGYDFSDARMDAFRTMGGNPKSSAQEV
ncbi:MAG: NAD(P)-binding domain-containing protein, partial [Pseudomonadota bacterium]